MSEAVKWTQRETMHMMGEGFSHMSFCIFADGKPTGIMRHTSTNGREGGFLTTRDTFECDGKAFDGMSAKKGELTAWLVDRRHEWELAEFDKSLAQGARPRDAAGKE